VKEFDLTELPDELLPKAEELPGELSLMARVIGVRPVLALEKEVGGTYLYVRKLDRLRERHRNIAMRREYDAGGITMRELARKNDMSESQAKNILNQSDGSCQPDDRQMGLFG